MLGIYTAQYDTASGQLSSAPAQPQQFKGLNLDPDLSPDGKSLAFMSQRDIPSPVNVTNRVIVIVDMTTGETREVIPALSYGSNARWTRDGKSFIVYGPDLRGRPGIWKVDAHTGEASLFIERSTCSGIPFPAADSGPFFCGGINVGGVNELIEVDGTSGALRRRLRVSSQPYAASPDGRYVVTSAFTLLTLATGESRPLLQLSPPGTQSFNSFSLDFTPDSQSVVFSGRYKGEQGMWRVPIDGSAPQRINVDVGSAILSWRFNSHTGKVAFSPIVVLDWRSGRWRISCRGPTRPPFTSLT